MSDDVIKLFFLADFQSCFERASGSGGRLLLSVIIIEQNMKTTCVWEDGMAEPNNNESSGIARTQHATLFQMAGLEETTFQPEPDEMDRERRGGRERGIHKQRQINR